MTSPGPFIWSKIRTRLLPTWIFSTRMKARWTQRTNCWFTILATSKHLWRQPVQSTISFKFKGWLTMSTKSRSKWRTLFLKWFRSKPRRSQSITTWKVRRKVSRAHFSLQRSRFNRRILSLTSTLLLRSSKLKFSVSARSTCQPNKGTAGELKPLGKSTFLSPRTKLRISSLFQSSKKRLQRFVI